MMEIKNTGATQASAGPVVGSDGLVDIRALRQGSTFQCALRVFTSSTERTKKDKPYLRLKLGNTTGSLPVKLWSIPPYEIHAGHVLWVDATYEYDAQWGAELKLKTFRLAAPGEYNVDDLFERPPYTREELEADLDARIATIADPLLAKVVSGLIGPQGKARERFVTVSAAKYFHEAYRGGLAAHSLKVAAMARAMAADEDPIVVDLATAGALLHDLGKILSYDADETGWVIQVTDNDTLFGHVIEGHYMVRREIEALVGEDPAAKPDLARRLEHIILSHHGALASGSPVTPATREAVIVCKADSACAMLGSFDRVQKGLSAGTTTSEFDGGIGGRGYFPQPSDEDGRA